MSNNNLKVDNIYWERVQMYVEGHGIDFDFSNKTLVLRNLTETIEMVANDVQIEGQKFKARFNVAILNDGDYLPSDEYLIVFKGEMDDIVGVNKSLLSLDHYDLEDEELVEYEQISTKNGKSNFLLERYGHEFQRGGISTKTTYTVMPKISREVNEFVIEVEFNKPPEKKGKLATKLQEFKMAYNSKSFEIRNFMFRAIFNTTKFFHLKKGNTVLFTSDSRAEMSGNFKFVYDEMLERKLDEKYRIHSLFKPDITERRKFVDKFKLPYLLGKADYIFVDDYHPLLYTVKFRKSQEIIQLWHAVGAFKTVGFSRTGKQGGPFFDSVNHRNYTKAFVSSENDIPFYGEAFGIKERNIIPTGVPRTDIFFDEQYKDKIVKEMTDELPMINGKKVILFAPTFRGNGHKSAHYPFFKIDFARLAKFCEEKNAVVLFKMHPFVKNKLNIPREYQPYFADISTYREVNDILFITDVLISDYSSLVYEFALFKRPMLFYAFDLEDYVSLRDFYEPYETFVPGKIVESFDDLIESLYKEDYEIEKVPPFVKKHYNFVDGRSSERIVRHLFGS
ncbi:MULTISPECIES: teichoic acid ribitol-phosphate polymerase TarL [unclassified Staphylococcus]|uniref:teichoic acid ribitol-phosphate polymerase TarL n=1 Tax=unclassified Staphylococcus TaxID=91994 RepID=UPI0021D126D3|nr:MULTISPECIES: teichoic acid ribitol-phosphate polymerase TarL [unclassified Staphylococcus]UXR71998.1 CDP-glycerol glycerophosphotransferase family protein [Staphylococcus sp. IVB6240]UXR74305.1 CDP-glycerol glycerophosphotransferase family protein [Staphylococcus sp. IVB6238]UXR76691.1 CDP-glycerol glycerophosphotransferase family protein [Staphylococcus sp. IVB6233]UXR80820.1 CDP-glycerol glycerophosphotransferase family protein [Staphylococcus sp. IVB6218]